MTHNARELILNFGQKHKHLPQLKFITENQDDLKISSLTGGFMNYLYLVQSANGQKSVVLKYAEEQASFERLKGHISLKRQLLEYNCLKLIYSLCPGGVAEPYVLDEELNIIAMEYLENMEVLGPALCNGQVDSDLATMMGSILGNFHFKTHRKVVSEETWKEFKGSLINEQMRETYFYILFTAFEEFDKSILDPPDVPQYEKLMVDIKSRGIFQEIRKIFRREDCLMHFDSHSLSIMLSQDRAAFIDFEFGGLGPVSFSLGYLLTFYYMATKDMRNKRTNERPCLIQETKEAMKNMVDAFFCAFGDRVEILGSRATFMSEMAARFGHTLFAFPIYVSYPQFIQAEREERKRFVDQGYQLMSSYQSISTLDDIFSVIF